MRARRRWLHYRTKRALGRGLLVAVVAAVVLLVIIVAMERL